MNILTLPLGPLATNCYLVCDQTGGVCAVIDPGASAQKILARAQDEGCKIAAILLTHAHFDHTGALRALHEALPQVPIYVHPADTDNAHNMSHGNLIYTDTYEEGDTVRVGTLEFSVLETPGHTPGSVCLRCADALFSGDTLFAGSCGRTDFEGGSTAQMFASLKRLSALSGDLHVYPGHGEGSTLERERGCNPYLQEAARR